MSCLGISTAAAVRMVPRALSRIFFGQCLFGMLFFILLLGSVLCTGQGQAAQRSAEVSKQTEQRVFTIAYIETGHYWSYDNLLAGIKEGLKKQGWGARVVFPDELRVSLGWGDENRAHYREKARELLQRKDYDLLLSFGTEATQAVLAENNGRVPIVAGSISNPLVAGIVKSSTDSGASNFTTAFNTMAGQNMFLIFHQIVGFTKLGILYNNTEAGKSYSFVNDAREVGRDVGFSVLEYDKLSASETVDECLTGIKELHKLGADAVFLSDLNCVDLEAVDPSPIYAYLDANKIANFSSTNRELVRNFAMMGLLLFDDRAVGNFQARQIIDILSGAIPGSLSMLVPYNYRLLINLEVIANNGIPMLPATLIEADEIFLKQLRMSKKVSP